MHVQPCSSPVAAGADCSVGGLQEEQVDKILNDLKKLERPGLPTLYQVKATKVSVSTTAEILM